MKRIRFAVAAIAVLLIVPLAYASSIKVWSTGETIRTADLNANFSHLHTAAEALITNAKVSSSAAIAHSKLATPALLPKAWASTSGVCSSTPCTIAASSGVASITRSGTGLYAVNWTTTRSDAAYGVLIQTHGVLDALCILEPVVSTTQVNVDCISTANAAKDVGFTVLLLDNT